MQGYYLEDLSAGMEASFAKTVTEADIVLFSGISGDTNPVHINEELARTSVFEGRIAHGMLTASFLSAVLGTKLPGPGSIYLSQSLKFKAPVRIGDTVTATARVKEVIVEKKRVVLETFCQVSGKTVLEGEAVIMVSSRA
ncbi:MaoC family dehydratase [Kiloniella laminariae]|uniref:MaoC family dehydratase n=1 Tax=Kiloniella laminariae TaxID=454162 RepID=A0ABT4LKU7_9PROT|nr:MaoC family dehydratase [Kiloniella laminariae]MCZ4281737.1 MaoC family dehydratase [Kiloniella laminariae]